MATLEGGQPSNVIAFRPARGITPNSNYLAFRIRWMMQSRFNQMLNDQSNKTRSFASSPPQRQRSRAERDSITRNSISIGFLFCAKAKKKLEFRRNHFKCFAIQRKTTTRKLCLAFSKHKRIERKINRRRSRIHWHGVGRSEKKMFPVHTVDSVLICFFFFRCD